MSSNQCTFCKEESDKCTVWYINNDRPEVSYVWVEKSSQAKVYVCDKRDCSLKYRQALNEIDYI